LVADLERCEALLGRLRPKPDPYLVRLPYGAGHMAPRLHRALRAWNPATQIAHWTVLTWDWTIAEGCSSRDQLARACVAAADRIMSLPGLAGSVLLLHEDPFDVGAPLAAEVAPILADRLLSRLRAAGLKGCTMVPIAAPTRLRRYLRG
jgi:peptidoglycan/xylan/chitin deacetylase (PgdA/CDA1 family)